jgi:hypothetical protein
VPNSLRQDRIDIVIIDLDRVAFDHRPALVGNLIPSTPRGCFGDVTGAHNLAPRIIKEVTDGPPNLVTWDARDQPIRIWPVTCAQVKVQFPESLAARTEKREAFEKE